MDDFFLPAAGQKRRAPAKSRAAAAKPAARASANGAGKRGGKAGRAAKPSAAQKRRREEEEKKADSDDDVNDEVGADALSSEVSESEEEQQKDPHAGETADEKRLRLAKELIEKYGSPAFLISHPRLRKPENEEESADDEDVAERIRLQTREKAGMVMHRVAESIQGLIIAPNSIRVCKNQQRLPITSVCIADDERTLFSASKDSSIVHWDVETCKKLHIFKGKHAGGDGHDGPVLAIATTTDGKLLATGGQDKVIRIWDLASHQLVGKLPSHKDAVSGLGFRAQSHQLFSASFDRAVKVWNVDDMSEVETLFGHQAEITSLDCIAKERFVTSGCDGTARVWKVVEETQLTFEHKSKSSLDCIAMLAEDNFVTGSQDGSISLWNITKKKASHVVEGAHSRPGQATGAWISALGSLRHSDLFASGASDGALRFWHWDPAARQIRAAFSAPVEGVINSIAFARTGRFVAAGVGRDHRLGRWFSCESDNAVRIVPLPLSLRSKGMGDEAAGGGKSA